MFARHDRELVQDLLQDRVAEVAVLVVGLVSDCRQLYLSPLLFLPRGEWRQS